MFDFEAMLLEMALKYEKIKSHFEYELSRIQTGSANPQLLKKFKISYFDEMTSLDNLSVITKPSAQQLIIKPFDIKITKDIEKTLSKSGLDITIANEGERIRVTFPSLTQERRKTLTKTVQKLQEEAKISIRSVRQDLNRFIKKSKDEIGEDTMHDYLKKLDLEINKLIKEIEALTNLKNAELLSINN